MKYLLDANVISTLYDFSAAQHPIIVKQLEQVSDDDGIVISILTVYEMEYAYANAPEQKQRIIRNDIDHLMRVCDIFTLPTYYFEGLPVSILEAMACRKPVVATQHRGCEDIVVQGETGWLVPKRHAAALAKTLLRCILDKPMCQRLGEAGRQRVEAEFELDRCTRLIADTIDKVCVR